MAEYHFPVPGSKDEGEIVIFVRRHWASFLGQFLLSSVILIIPTIILVLIYFLARNIFQGLALNFLVLFFSIYYLIAITFAFISWLSFYYDIYIVTRSEIIDIVQEGFFGRKISQLSLLRVQDVSSTIKGIFPTLFAYGDVLVETAGEQTQNFLLRAIPNPQEICSKIMELHDKIVEREERGQQLSEGEGFLHAQKAPPPSTDDQKLLQENITQLPSNQGEVTKDDLDKGGEIELK